MSKQNTRQQKLTQKIAEQMRELCELTINEARELNNPITYRRAADYLLVEILFSQNTTNFNPNFTLIHELLGIGHSKTDNGMTKTYLDRTSAQVAAIERIIKDLARHFDTHPLSTGTNEAAYRPDWFTR